MNLQTTLSDGTIVPLKNPRLAALLAWLVPGLGHLYQGRTAKGVLLAVCIISTFVYGCYLGGGRVVYASTANPPRNVGRFIDRWHIVCQGGIGGILPLAYLQAARMEADQPALFGDWAFGAPDYQPTTCTDASGRPVLLSKEADAWQYQLGFYFELGTWFTAVAGLLNLLAIYDAYAGPLEIAETKSDTAE